MSAERAIHLPFSVAEVGHPEARKQKAARRRPIILMPAEDQARRSAATWSRRRQARKPIEPWGWPSDAVSAAGLAGAVGVQRVGGEDAHADQSEDTC